MLNVIGSSISHGHARSINAKRNIVASLLIRGCSIGISFLLVPLTINYISSERYGIWLTLSSLISLFSFFDIGLTNGLRNRFAEAKAKEDESIAQTYVSTAFALLSIIFLALWLVFVLINQSIDWATLLRVKCNIKSEIAILAIIVFTYFCIQFILRIITTILVADQKSAKASFIDVLGQLLSLATIFVLTKTCDGSLIRLGLALCASPIVVLVVTNLVLFNGSYGKYKPRVSKVDFSYGKRLFNLGAIFFVIQIAGIIQFESANIIIARKFDLANVTSYNIVYKYFGVPYMLLTIFLTPFWSGSTEAFSNGDITWIKNAMRRYNQLNLLLFILAVIMLLASQPMYQLWLGKGKLNISYALSFYGFLFFSLSMLSSKYVIFLNGISALRIQFITCLMSPFIYIGTALFLIDHCGVGVHSIFIASIFSNLHGYLLAPLQYYMIVKRGKRGIWIK